MTFVPKNDLALHELTSKWVINGKVRQGFSQFGTNFFVYTILYKSNIKLQYDEDHVIATQCVSIKYTPVLISNCCNYYYATFQLKMTRKSINISTALVIGLGQKKCLM